MFRTRVRRDRHSRRLLPRMRVDWLRRELRLRPQRENIPLVITSICCSVSIPPAALRERGHRCSADAVGDNVAHRGFIDDGQIHGIGQGNRRSSTAFRAVAAGTVLCVESVEVQNLARGNWFRIASRFTMRSAASSEHHHRLRTASAERVLIRFIFISGSPRSLVVASFRELRFLPAEQTKHSRG